MPAAARAVGTLGGVPTQPARRPLAARALEHKLVALLALACWSVVPPYLGPLIGLELDVSSTVELVDHVVTGVCAIAGALIALVEARRGATDSVRYLAALGVCVLAGLFQTVTHFTLVLDAGDPLRPVDTVILHASPGPVLLLFSLYLLLTSPTDDATR